ncbi:MAG: DUF2336 domain-containing protein [Alphaproteobacteria bacterium]|nr:DUF2336 domain-containing protein [Alphaproteobacteria bacterium]
MVSAHLLEATKKLKLVPNQEHKINMIRTLADCLNSSAFGSQELGLAEDILRLSAKDEVKVRAAVSTHLSSSQYLPHDLALLLAEDDEDQVSLPILEYSPVLTQDDLLQFVHKIDKTGSLRAIARREDIGFDLSHELVAKDNPEVSETLLGNKNAHINDQTFYAVLKQSNRYPSLVEYLCERTDLSSTLVDKLYVVVAEESKEQLMKQYPRTAKPVISSQQKSNENTILAKVATHDSRQVFDYVSYLYQQKRLTPSLTIRSLCYGNLNFFEAAMSRLAGIPFPNAKRLIRDGGNKGFKLLYQTSKLPDNLYDGLQLLVDFVIANPGLKPADFRKKLTSHIIKNRLEESIPSLTSLLNIISEGV